MKFKIFIIIVGLLLVSACSSDQVGTEVIQEPSNTSIPTKTQKPTITVAPSSTPVPTQTWTPTPTSTSTPAVTPTPVTINIEADGSGDYWTLEEAVQNAPEGANIFLGPGVYDLEKNLTIGKSLQLIGSGMDDTEIVSDDYYYVIYATGQESFGVEGITIRHQGNKYANVVKVKNVNNIEFENCRFTGAVYSEVNDEGGWGLVIGPDTHGIVKNCEAGENQVTGIGIKSKDIHIDGNTCKDNDQFGIVIVEVSNAFLLGNECTGNAYSGILVTDNSYPTLEDNSLTGNGENGIIFAGNSTGTIRKNIVSNNGFSGITLYGNANPSVEENTCEFNNRDGITLYENSSGEFRGNRCAQNKFDGISVNDKAHPTITGNLFQDNGNNGIAFLDESTGEATQNECSGNMKCIHIEDTANPEVSDNYCHDNLFGDPAVNTPPVTAKSTPDPRVYNRSIEEFLCRIEDIPEGFDFLYPESPVRISNEEYIKNHEDPGLAKDYIALTERDDLWYLHMRYTKFDTTSEDILLANLGSLDCSVMHHKTVEGAVYAVENPPFFYPDGVSPVSSVGELGQQSILEIIDSNSRVYFRYQNITGFVEITGMDPKDGIEIIQDIAEKMLERIQAASFTTP